MNAETKESKESTEVTAPRPAGSLLSFDEFDNFFDDFLSRRWPRLLDLNFPSASSAAAISERSMPKVDILDFADRIVVQAALPGINKDNLEVTINNQLITIRASTKEEKEEKKEEGKYFRKEIIRGEFQRTLSLPDNVDNENATAAFKDGILKITIPKTEKSQRKNIEIT
ncbi:MAG: Hsp20/alpha crystallin family protein [Methylococcaceae bacterium]|nr:Hsp20/alpha crystallin family protein [Methylococcaceae bacterium]